MATMVNPPWFVDAEIGTEGAIRFVLQIRYLETTARVSVLFSESSDPEEHPGQLLFESTAETALPRG
jgi:hypothetical protein